ncbi:DNA cytosine methyltransferase [Priestia megaterium]|uniref:DNA cytosine methyltransferase n=1 Tax=Priestia megaterium TaxID=1404 RepID=UPI002E22615C|nr:DNA cytosine methyltransferase [Priestia megaterium]
MIVIDLFSGAGGLSEGFHGEGFKTIAQVEKDKWACETLKTRTFFHFLKEKRDLDTYFKYVKSAHSYKGISTAREEVYIKYPELKEKISFEILNKKFGNPANDPEASSSNQIIKLIEKSAKYNNVNNVDLLIGGPPCQAYSLIGRSRMKEEAERDNRNFLFYYYLKLVKEFRPKAFLFENVPGILNAKKGMVFGAIQEEFDNIGYTILSGKQVDHKKNVLDFSDFGVGQKRKRVILFGFRKNLNYQYPNFDKYKIRWEHRLDTASIISDLPSLKPGSGEDFAVVDYVNNSSTSLTDYQAFMRRDSIGIMNHKARPLQDRDREIYQLAIEKAKNGEQLKYFDLPARLKTHKNEKAFLDRFKVHWSENTPHTIVAHISKDGHYNIHPDINQARSLTVREAARIQSFPDNYKFEGPRTYQFTQVGNAVPPIASKVMAKAVKELLR